MATHLDGNKRIPELKKRTTRVDFGSSIDLKSQVQEGLVADFAFEKYAERIKIVNRMLNPDGACQEELSIIRKHVQIRNSIQHQAGRVCEGMLKEIGSQQVGVLDQHGNLLNLSAGESIQLFVPELDHLKGALFRLTNYWRVRFA